MYDNQEKRKCRRIELTKRKYRKIVPPYIARFRVKQYEDQEKTSLHDWNIVAVKNLGAGGIIFEHKRNLLFDTLLNLRIEFLKSIPAINCIGRVIRIEESQLNPMFRIATEFVEIKEQERELINTTVETILRKQAKGVNVYLKKLDKIIQILTRSEAKKEARDENSEILKTKDITKKTAKKESLTEKVKTSSIVITKEYIKETFRLPKASVPDAKSVHIVGDFNNWDIHANPMKKNQNGDYIVSVDLEHGRAYQYRYLIDKSKWEKDYQADKHVKSYCGDIVNSVIIAGY